MGCRRISKMGMLLQVFLFFCCSFWAVSSAVAVSAEAAAKVQGTVFVDGRAAVGRTDNDFICATLDWWPPEKCDYGICSWDHTSLLNLDLSNKILLNAVKAFAPLKIRLGGTLQDKVIYGTPDLKQPCLPFKPNSTALYGFTQGCLPLKRWDELNAFFQKAGAKVIFGLNALSGRFIEKDGSTTGDWNYANAESLIRYSAQKNYPILGWELGNELCGNGVGASISAQQYALDTITLKDIVNNLYKGPKPLVLGPGGFFDATWFKDYIDKSQNALDAATHHIYNLGPGVDEHLMDKILDPSYLDGVAVTFRNLQNVIRNSPTKAVAWVGESGGAYNSGHNLISNAFVYSFWYLDQLGMSSVFDTRTYCRQSLIGGNYGLLNTTTFKPNPDYYSALLWNRLMGTNALSTSFSGSKKIRSYTHCARQSKGITVLLMNLDNTTGVLAKVKFNNTLTLRHMTHRYGNISDKRTFAHQMWGSNWEIRREEYHLSPKDGNLHSQTMLLNGRILSVSSTGEIPPLEPIKVKSAEPITVAPSTIVFVHIPNVVVPACS